jgi:pimeloyl-ACP methyl ester carboxylesterase
MAEARQDVIELDRAGGHTIHCVHDHTDPANPLVVVPPIFEGTSRRNAMIALYLLRNGFNSLRFDFTNHRGCSSGTTLGFTLSSAYEDHERVLAFAGEKLDRGGGVALASASLSSRVCLRYVAEHPDVVDVHVSLLGVVAAGKTIRIATGWDVQDLLDDPSHRYGIDYAMHSKIDGELFMPDLIAAGWHSIEGSIEEARRMETPTGLIVAEDDPWVDIHDCERVFGPVREKLVDIYKIPNAGHQVHKDLNAAKTATRAMLDCLRSFYDRGDEPAAPEPTIVELLEVNTAERAREARYAPAHGGLEAPDHARR